MNICRIVATGSECTGKSTLLAALSTHFGVPVVSEYLRDYTANLGRQLTYADALPVAKGQIAREDATEAGIWHPPHPPHARPLVLFDTNILSSVVYNRHYYGKNPQWILQTMRCRPYDHYLLCDIDIPWQPDGQRDRPEHRQELQGMFIEALNEFGCSYTLISGSRDMRLQNGIHIVNQIW